MRFAPAVVLLATVGCVEDAFVSRDPAAFTEDAAVVDERPASASLLVQVTVGATGVEAMTSDDFESTININVSRNAVPTDVAVSLTLPGSPDALLLPPFASGQYFATVGEYDPALVLSITDSDGVAHRIALGDSPMHMVTVPHHGDRLDVGDTFHVEWAPSGGAEAALLLTSDPHDLHPIDDIGHADPPAAWLPSAHDSLLLRVRRAFNTPLPDFAPGSLLRVEVVNGVVVTTR